MGVKAQADQVVANYLGVEVLAASLESIEQALRFLNIGHVAI